VIEAEHIADKIFKFVQKTIRVFIDSLCLDAQLKTFEVRTENVIFLAAIWVVTIKELPIILITSRAPFL
jgi:hypothetical protein